MSRTNEFGQPVGDPVPAWVTRPLPSRRTLGGRWCSLEALDPDRHGAWLLAGYRAEDGRHWTYLPDDPATNDAQRLQLLRDKALSADPLHYAVVNPNGTAIGTAALMRIDPANGVIEIGHVNWTPALQRTSASTEAQYLLLQYVFDQLGYRRVEWKCDALNQPSRTSAQRLGFTFEGVFRQAVVTKGRNRDTAWYAIIDADWPRVRAAFQAWLDPTNFDDDGAQRQSLAALRASPDAD